MLFGGFEFKNDVYCVKCNAFNTAVANNDYLPASGSFIDMAPFDHGVFLVGIGTLNTATPLAVQQDTSATATGSIKAVTSAAQTIAANDDDKWATIEFNANQLDRAGGFRYVTLKAADATGSDDFLCVFFLGFKKRKGPVTQETNYVHKVSVVT